MITLGEFVRFFRANPPLDGETSASRAVQRMNKKAFGVL